MFLFHLHSAFRYLAILAGLAVIAYALRGAMTGRPHDKNMKNLAITFRVLMDVTLFLGVAMVMTGYGFYNDLGMHIVLMTLATVVSHIVPAVMRKRTQDARSYLPYAVASSIALALVALGTVVIGKPVVG